MISSSIKFWCLICWALWLAAGASSTAAAAAATTTADSNDEDEALLAEVVSWVKANGGWISGKVEIQQLRPGLSTIVTNEPLEKGEAIVTVPWDIILTATVGGKYHWCDRVETVRRAITKAPELQTPYERYLAARPRGTIPRFWSRRSKSLLAQIMDGFVVHGFQNDMEEYWFEECETPADEDHIHAMMLLQTRGEGEDIDLLVPFGDLLNHRVSTFLPCATTVYTRLDCPNVDPHTSSSTAPFTAL